MWQEVTLAEGFITRDQLPEIPYAKSPKDQSYRRSSFSVKEWVQLEKAARTYWIEGKSRYDEEGNLLGYHQISRGPNKGKESDRPITRNSLYGVNKGKGTKQSPRAKQQQVHRRMLYVAMRISMESGIRIGSLRKMRWEHISENKTLSKEDQQIWCLVEVPAENTKTGRWHQLSAPIAHHLKKLRKLTHPKSKQDLLFRNQSTGKALSDRIWRDGLQEMLVESGLATWAEGDSNDLRETDITSGKNLTWYAFRDTWITFVLKRGVRIANVCNNSDTSIQYVHEHYFHYDARRATDALSTGRGQLKGATSTDWMHDSFVSNS